MLIMAISYGAQSDPFTISDDTEALFDNPKDALAFICGQRKVDDMFIDEIFIIKDDKIARHFTAEDWTDG